MYANKNSRAFFRNNDNSKFFQQKTVTDTKTQDNWQIDKFSSLLPQQQQQWQQKQFKKLEARCSRLKREQNTKNYLNILVDLSSKSKNPFFSIIWQLMNITAFFSTVPSFIFYYAIVISFVEKVFYLYFINEWYFQRFSQFAWLRKLLRTIWHLSRSIKH